MEYLRETADLWEGAGKGRGSQLKLELITWIRLLASILVLVPATV